MKREMTDQFVSDENNDIPKFITDSLPSGKGHLVLDGDLEITGVFSGMLKLNGNLTVGKNARITGDLIVNNLSAYGQIVGSVNVINNAVFFEGSKFAGALTAFEAEFCEGSLISGTRRIKKVSRQEKNEIIADSSSVISSQGMVENRMNYPIFSI